MEEIPLHDVPSVRKRADKLLADNQNIPDESRAVYTEFIMDWTDNYTENLQDSDDELEKLKAVDCIVQLWIEFANMEKNLRQWKRAVKVFDDALADPIVSKSGKIYAAYANYYKERSKLSNAQKVYLRSLTSNLAQREVDLIWVEYLDTMHTNGSAELSLEELVSAISQQVESKTLSPPSAELIEKCKTKPPTPAFPIPSDDTVTIKSESSSIPNQEHPIIKSEVCIPSQQKIDTETTVVTTISTSTKSITATNDEIKTSSMQTTPALSAKTQEHVEVEVEMTVEDLLPDLNDMGGFDAAVLISKHHTRPPLLFCSPKVEPMASGLENLSDKEIQELESFLSISLTEIKKDINFYYNKTDVEKEKDSSMVKLEQILDVLEGLWFTQALKERHFDAWFSTLKKKQMKEDYDIKRNRGDRDKINASMNALQRTKDAENKVLAAIINRIFLTLLLEQINVLVAVGLPYFSSETMKRLQEWTQASISREENIIPDDSSNNISIVEVEVEVGKEHEKEVNSNIHKETTFMSLHNGLEEEIGQLRRIVCALLSLRLCKKEKINIKPKNIIITKDNNSSGSNVHIPPSSVHTDATAAELYQAAMESQKERQKEALLLEQMRLKRQNEILLRRQEMLSNENDILKKKKKRRRIEPNTGAGTGNSYNSSSSNSPSGGGGGGGYNYSSSRWESQSVGSEEMDIEHHQHQQPHYVKSWGPGSRPGPGSSPMKGGGGGGGGTYGMGMGMVAGDHNYNAATATATAASRTQRPKQSSSSSTPYSSLPLSSSTRAPYTHVPSQNEQSQSQSQSYGRDEAAIASLAAAAAAAASSSMHKKSTVKTTAGAVGSSGTGTGSTSTPSGIHEGSLPLLQKLANMLKNAKKAKT